MSEKEIADSGMFDDGKVIDEEIEALETQDDEEPLKAVDEEDTETTEDDSSEEDTETSDSDEISRLFEEKGLKSQYGDVRELITRIPETNRYVTQLEQQNQEMLKLLRDREARSVKDEESPQLTPEDFYDNPQEAIKKMGLVSREEARQEAFRATEEVLQRERVIRFKKETPDYEKHRPEMERLFRTMPELDALPIDRGMEILYQLAVANDVTSARVEDNSGGNNADKKTRANTSGGKAKRPGGRERTVEDYAGMSIDKLEKELGYS